MGEWLGDFFKLLVICRDTLLDFLTKKRILISVF